MYLSLTDENSPLVYRPSGQIQIASNFRTNSVAKAANHQGTTIMVERMPVLALLIVAMAGLSACGGGGGGSPAATTSAPPPPPVTDLSWDDGNWDTENWQ